MKISRYALIGTLAIAASLAFSQAAGPGNQGGTTQQGSTTQKGGFAGQGGAKGQGKGAKQGKQGRLGAFMAGGTRLLLNEAVQKELKMTPDQIDKAKAAVGGLQDRQRGQAQAGAQKGQRKAGGFGQMQDQARQEQEQKVKAILDDRQFERFSQIELQAQGAGALTRKDITDKVGLSSDQVAQIQSIQQEQMQTLRQALQASRDANVGTKGAGGAMREQFMKMREESNGKILAVLNRDQKKKWDTLLGPAFSMK